MDEAPVMLSLRIALDNPDLSASRIMTESGATRTPLCATLRPAPDASKRQTVLVIGELGSERDPAVRIGALRSVPLLNGVAATGLLSGGVKPLMLWHELRIGHGYARNEVAGASCPATPQIVQINWAEGVTAPVGNVLGEAARMGRCVTFGKGVEATPIAPADLGNNDTELRLDTQTPAELVTVEPGVVIDSRGDPIRGYRSAPPPTPMPSVEVRECVLGRFNPQPPPPRDPATVQTIY